MLYAKNIFFNTFLFLFLLIFVGIFFVVLYREGRVARQDMTHHQESEGEAVDDAAVFPISVSPPPETTLLFGGDVMLSRVVGQQIEKQNDVSWPFAYIHDTVSSADISLVNLESPFSKTGPYVVPTGSFTFKANPNILSALEDVGIDMVTLANNHFGNQGQEGMLDTFALLSEHQIAYIGAGENNVQAHRVVIQEINGTRFGFLGYAYPETLYVATEKKAGIANMNIDQAVRDVRALQEDVDVVIVTMHAGEEYTRLPNAQQKQFAHAVIDAGADLVVGHHPHWVQVTEIYQGKPILYSLGNLIFDQMWSRETQQGALARVVFRDTTLDHIEIIPIRIHNDGQPHIVDDDTEREEILKRMGLSSPFISFNHTP